MINDYKIQLTMEINFISSKPYSEETCNMHTKSNTVEIMMGGEKDEVTEEIFESLLK